MRHIFELLVIVHRTHSSCEGTHQNIAFIMIPSSILSSKLSTDGFGRLYAYAKTHSTSFSLINISNLRDYNDTILLAYSCVDDRIPGSIVFFPKGMDKSSRLLRNDIFMTYEVIDHEVWSHGGSSISRLRDTRILLKYPSKYRYVQIVEVQVMVKFFFNVNISRAKRYFVVKFAISLLSYI